MQVFALLSSALAIHPEPAVSTMLTFPRLCILPTGPISRPGRRLPPRGFGRRGTLVSLTASPRRCSVPLAASPGRRQPRLTILSGPNGPRRTWVTLSGERVVSSNNPSSSRMPIPFTRVRARSGSLLVEGLIRRFCQRSTQSWQAL